MMVYGYTKVCSKADRNGKESDTLLFASARERNHIMYTDYSDSFDFMESNGSFSKADCNGNPKQTEEEFMEKLENSYDPDYEVFGKIQASDSHVQFEPFCKTV